MNARKLKRELEDARDYGVRWGHHLFDSGKLPIDSPFLPLANTRRRQAVEKVFETALFAAYLDAAEFAGETTPSGDHP